MTRRRFPSLRSKTLDFHRAVERTVALPDIRNASATAATAHRSQPAESHLRSGQRMTMPKATPFPVGATNRPGTGRITSQGKKTDPTAAGLG